MKIYLERHWLDEQHDRITVFFGSKHSIDYVPARDAGASDVDARDRLRAALYDVSVSRDKALVELERTQKELNCLSGNSSRRISALESEIIGVRSELAACKRSLVDARATNDGTRSELRSVRFQLEQALFQRNDAIRKLNEWVTEVEGVRAENRILIGRLQASVEARDGLIGAIIGLREQLKQARNDADGLRLRAELRSAQDSALAAMADAARANAFLTQCRAAKQATEARCEIAQRSASAARNAMAVAIGALDESRAELASRGCRIAELEAELAKRSAVRIIGEPEIIPRALTADEVNARYVEAVRHVQKQTSVATHAERPMSAMEFEAMLEPVGSEDQEAPTE